MYWILSKEKNDDDYDDAKKNHFFWRFGSINLVVVVVVVLNQQQKKIQWLNELYPHTHTERVVMGLIHTHILVFCKKKNNIYGSSTINIKKSKNVKTLNGNQILFLKLYSLIVSFKWIHKVFFQKSNC